MLASIDLETTGINPQKDQVLEIAVVVDDLSLFGDKEPLSNLKTFHCYVKHDKICGNPNALIMNQRILEILAGDRDPKGVSIKTPSEALKSLADFLSQWEKLTPTGKNVAGFDLPFLDQLCEDNPELGGNCFYREFLSHRCLDAGSVFFDPSKDENKLPNLQKCLDRADLGTEVKHTAVEDAKDVLRLLRYKYYGIKEQ